MTKKTIVVLQHFYQQFKVKMKGGGAMSGER